MPFVTVGDLRQTTAPPCPLWAGRAGPRPCPYRATCPRRASCPWTPVPCGQRPALRPLRASLSGVGKIKIKMPVIKLPLARNKALATFQKKTTKVLQEKGGLILSAAGTVATVIPVVGWIAGPLMVVAGGALAAAQQARLAKKIAERRKKDLESAKNEWVAGNLTDEQYEARVKKIAGEEAASVIAEDIAEQKAIKEEKATSEKAIISAKGIVERPPDAPPVQTAPTPAPAPAPKTPKTALVVGGVAAVGLLIVIGFAAAGRRK